MVDNECKGAVKRRVWEGRCGMKPLGWVLVFVLACGLAGCSLPGGSGDEGDEDGLGPPTAEPGPPDPVEDMPEGMDLADCPLNSALTLKFSANFTIEEGEFSMTHQLEDGLLSLMVDAAGNIRALEPPQIPYTVTGTAGDCTLNGQGSMTPDATGYCVDGVVQLIIVEDWAPGSMTVTCDDVTQPVQLPGPGPMTHTGADGRGEVFYLDRGFTEEGVGAGFTTMRPFAQGSGEHIWTLYMPEVELVPLVP